MNPLLILLFFASGMAALIYEVVWQQLLQLIIGSSTVSVGILLGVLMGGMCLGSLVAPRLAWLRRAPVRAYALLEWAIGLIGIALWLGMPVVARLYASVGGAGASGVFMRGVVCAACLIPPTVAMGATFPVIAHTASRSSDGRARLGQLYSANVAGAVAGCLIAGFCLLRLFDMGIATYVAAALNFTIGAVAWTIRPESRVDVPPEAGSTGGAVADRNRIVYGAIALSGFNALAAEVVWTRYLALAFGATVYTFSIVLAVFLVGLGLGSSAGAAVVRTTRQPARWLAWCQLATVPAMCWSARILGDVLPFWRDPTVSDGIWSVMAIDFARTLTAILPAPLLWGASFPLALAAAGFHDGSGAIAGRVYAANTAGAIAGSLLASLLLIPALGSQQAQRVMVCAALAAGTALLWPQRRGIRSLALGGAIGALGLAGLLMIPRVPPLLVAYGRHAANWTAHAGEIIYVGEGMHASVAVSRTADGVLNYHNAGKIQASSQPADMRLQRMLGHLTTLMPSKPKSILVIGCGAGVTAGAVAVNPAVERVTIVDIEPLVPRVAGQYFGSVNHDVLRNPKVHLIADDARHYLQTTTQKFDAITSDPLDPWVKGAATLYSREFLDVVREHLNPGGVMTLYVQLFESSPAAVKSEVATFFDAFPEGLMFGNSFEGHAIDTVLVGPAGVPEIWVDEIESMLRQPAFAQVDSSLTQISLFGAADLFGNYAGRARDLQGWLTDAEINHDRDLRLQYLAGLGLNLHSGDDIYREILSYRTYPDDLFVASESTIERLKQAMEGVRE